MTKHNFYKTGDTDAPEQILDRNGVVVLALCRHCRKTEAELSDDCPDPLGLAVATEARINAQEGQESTIVNSGPAPADGWGRLAMIQMSRAIADPMWADHAEVPKSMLKEWHATVNKLLRK